MNRKKETVQVVPLGLELDRFIELFREFKPDKVYFVKKGPEFYSEKDWEQLKAIEEKLRKVLPLSIIESKTFEISPEKLDYSDIFEWLLRVMCMERRKGNRVIVNVAGGSRLLICAAVIAASISHSEVYYIRAEEYMPKINEHYLSTGTAGEVMKIPTFPIPLPKKVQRLVLARLFDEGAAQESVSLTLQEIVEKIGKQNLGSETDQSAVVKLSGSLHDLEDDGYIEIKSSGTRKREIRLTDEGELMARTIKIRNEIKSMADFSTK
jgi:hypothetical protein